MEHTEGKLKVIQVERVKAWLQDEKGNAVAQAMFIDEHGYLDMHRLALAWNACEGMETRSLEGLNFKILLEHNREEYKSRLNQSEKVGERLLQALKYSKRMMRNIEDDVDMAYVNRVLEEAIKLAEEGSDK